MTRTSKKLLAVLAAAGLALGTAAPAFAQSGLEGYNEPGGVVQERVGGDQNGVAGTPTGSEAGERAESGSDPVAAGKGGADRLPFTGLDVALMAGAGMLLGLFGLGMRRLTRAAEPV